MRFRRLASDWQTAYKSLVSAEVYRLYDTTKHDIDNVVKFCYEI